MSLSPEYPLRKITPSELSHADPDRILIDKFTDFARQVKLAKHAEIFIVPALGEFVAQRDWGEILAACVTHGCTVTRRPDTEELVGHRTPARADGSAHLSWEYVWDTSGRLTHLTGTPLGSEGRPNEIGASKEYEFKYLDGGQLDSAVIKNYTLDSFERNFQSRIAISLSMNQERKTLPRDLTLASFSDRLWHGHVSGLMLPEGSLVDLTRLSSVDQAHAVLPGERIAELGITIPFLQKRLLHPLLFETSRSTILQKEVARQLAGAMRELKEMHRQQARDCLDVAYALNDAYSSRVGDIFCDPDLGPREKRAQILQFERDVAQSLADAGNHMTQEEGGRMLSAVRAAVDLLDE